MVVSISARMLVLSTAAPFARSSFDNGPALPQRILIPHQFQMDLQLAKHSTMSNFSMCFDDAVSATLVNINTTKLLLNNEENMIHNKNDFIIKKTEPNFKETTIKTTEPNFKETTTVQEEYTCRVYIAPSTIPGAGYGMFAGVSFRKGDMVTPGDGVVPIHNPVFHNGNVEHENTLLWDEYVWSASTFTAMNIPDQSIEAASFGIGALPNCYFALLNVEDSETHGRDNANLETMNSPGIGAFTPWYDRKSYATKNIHVGSELYVDYGYAYFTSRVETMGYIPFLDDYTTANRVLKRFSMLANKFESKSASKVASSTSHITETLFQLSRNILETWPNRVYRALPQNSTLIEKVMQHGGTIRQDYLRSIRNIDYLKTFGACMDHLYVESSKLLPHAGRGVFTSRSFKKGSVVATVPLIHIPERKVLTMYGESKYDAEFQPDEPTRNITDPIHQQLLLNYCFGHNESTLLLCPYGVVSSLVNHGPKTTEVEPKENEANLRIQWSTKITKNPEWWNMNISSWAYMYRAGLAFEYVALRDIDAHEEILIDYGVEWQTAWEEHVENWKPVQRLVDTLNEDIDSVIPTSKEWAWIIGDININPHAVNLWCYDIYRTFQGFSATDLEAYPCKVTLRLPVYNNNATSSYIYTAEIFERRQNEDDETCEEIFDEVLWSLPRDVFVYGGYNEVYDTNQYIMPTTFRHEIGIPHVLMPQAWKNFGS